MNELLKRGFFGLVFLTFVFFPLWLDFESKSDSKYFVLTLYVFAIIGIFELAKLASNYYQRKVNLIFAYILTTLCFALPLVQLATGDEYLRVLISSFTASQEKMIFFSFFIALPVTSVMLLSVLSFVPRMNQKIYKNPTILCFIYIVVPLSCLAMMYSLAINYIIIPLLVLALASTYINDSFAYIFGRLFGKHKMFPSISPKKTWEGFAGGLISLIIVCILVVLKFDSTKVFYICVFAVIVTMLSTAGDLFESKLKRLAGVKDSGTILPGHGGILDRIDAMLFTTYIATMTLYLLKLV